MNKYAEYKEAYKAMIKEALLKESAYQKVVNEAKKQWKEVSGAARAFLKDNNMRPKGHNNPKMPWDTTRSPELLEKVYSTLPGIPFSKPQANVYAGKNSMAASYQLYNKALDELYKQVPNIENRTAIERLIGTMRDRSIRAGNEAGFNNIKIKNLESRLYETKNLLRDSYDNAASLKDSLGRSQDLAKLLGIGTGIGAVGTGYGLLKD